MDIPYIEYFGLKEKPFGITPDPSFFFESATHREALDHLGFFIGLKEGFALISGDVGTGKTMLSRIFLSSLDPEHHNTALILNPIMTDEEFLREVLKEFAVPCPAPTKKGMLDALEAFLIAEFAKGKKCVLVVDEAQLLTKEVLEFVRILSNLETDKEKILHIVLFAQPELTERLKEEQLRYLTQRITVVYVLKPLTLEEVGPYINYRLIKAGSKGTPGFSPEAVRRIFIASKGYPRLVNIIADRCLLGLYARSGTTVDEAVAEEALKEQNISVLFDSHRPPSGPGIRQRPSIYLAGALWLILVILLLGLAGLFPAIHDLFWKSDHRTPQAAVSPAAPVSPAASPARVEPTRSEPQQTVQVPAPLAVIPQGEHILICERETGKLSLFAGTGNGTVSLVKAIPCSLNPPGQRLLKSAGEGGGELIFFSRRQGAEIRRQAGRNAISFLLVNFLPSGQWAPGAARILVLHKGETGSGAAEHPALAVDDDSMRELWPFMKSEGTPLILTGRIRLVDGKVQGEAAQQVMAFLKEWRESWEGLDAKRHLSLYGPGFVKDGVGRKTFADRKAQIMGERTYVRVALENPAVFVFRGQSGTHAAVRALQRYYADNYADETLKLLTLVQKDGHWLLMAEETVSTPR